MATKTQRRRKRVRRARNKISKQACLEDAAVRPAPNSITFKARKGDAVSIEVKFDGTAAPYDPESENPGEGLREAVAVQKWADAGAPTVGEA